MQRADYREPPALPSLPAGVTLAPMKARGCRVLPGGAVLWYWRGRGPRPARRLLWMGWGTVGQAVEAAMAGLVAGRPSRPVEAPRPTVAALLEGWATAQANRSDLAAGTLRSYKRHAATVTRWIGDRELGAVSEDLVQAFIAGRLDEQDQYGRGRSPRTVAQEVNILAIAWKWGRRHDMTARVFPRVTVKVDRAKHMNNHRTPTDEEIGRVLAALRGQDWLAVRLLVVTGARVSEVADLTAEQVNAADCCLTLAGKTGSREVPLDRVDMDRVTGHLHADPPGEDRRVFRWRDGRGRPGYIGNNRQRVQGLLRGACDAAGVERFTPHGLRRAAVRRLVRRGVDVGAAAALMGHSVGVMLSIYDAVSLEEKRAAMVLAGVSNVGGSEAEALPANVISLFGVDP